MQFINGLFIKSKYGFQQWNISVLDLSNVYGLKRKMRFSGFISLISIFYGFWFLRINSVWFNNQFSIDYQIKTDCSINIDFEIKKLINKSKFLGFRTEVGSLKLYCCCFRRPRSGPEACSVVFEGFAVVLVIWTDFLI